MGIKKQLGMGVMSAVLGLALIGGGEDQNQFQGDSLNLTWTFTATQTAGEEK